MLTVPAETPPMVYVPVLPVRVDCVFPALSVA
jgi:hypothetical protein